MSVTLKTTLFFVITLALVFAWSLSTDAATAGYTSQGASDYAITSGSSNENPSGLLITLPVEGTVSSASGYFKYVDQGENLNFSIYAGSAGSRGSLLYTSNSGALTSTSYTLETRTFASPPTLSAGTYWLHAYVVAGGPFGGDAFHAYDAGGATDTGYSLTDLGSPIYNENQYSMYVTYTPTEVATPEPQRTQIKTGRFQVKSGRTQIK